MLEQKLADMINNPELRGGIRFVENFFNTLRDESLEAAYLNYLRDLELYAPTNRTIRECSTYFCYIFSQITHSPIEELLRIESMFRSPRRG